MQEYSGFTKITIGGKERPFYYGLASGTAYKNWKEEKLRLQGTPREVEFDEFEEAMRIAFGADKTDEQGNVIEKRKFNPFKAIDIIYACLMAGCKYSTLELKEPVQVDFTHDHVDFWIQNTPSEEWAKMGKAIAGANVSPNASEPQQAAQENPAK